MSGLKRQSFSRLNRARIESTSRSPMPTLGDGWRRTRMPNRNFVLHIKSQPFVKSRCKSVLLTCCTGFCNLSGRNTEKLHDIVRLHLIASAKQRYYVAFRLFRAHCRRCVRMRSGDWTCLEQSHGKPLIQI